MALPLAAALAPAAIQTVGGLFSSIFSGAGKAERELENLQTPTYNGSQPINSYYQEALRRYGVNPYNSAGYTQQTNQIGNNSANAMNALSDRRSATAGIGSIVSASDAAAQQASAAAEAEQNRRFGEYGNATEMKSGDDMKKFETNSMLPFQKRYQLLAMKAQAANSRKNAGMQNAMGGLNNATTILDSKLSQ